MGRQIQNDAELAKIITDKDALATIQASVKEGNPYPIIYVMNHEARLAHAAYLGGRPNTQQEQIDIFEKIPGNNILDKATHAGIPFSGCFSAGNREFRSVGDWAFLMSSSAYRTGHRSLNLDRGFRDVNDSWGNPQLGFSALVVKDKK